MQSQVEADRSNVCAGPPVSIEDGWEGSALLSPDPTACPGAANPQKFPCFVLLVSATYPTLRSVGASLVICLPITAPVEGQPLGLFSSCRRSLRRPSSSVAVPSKLPVSSRSCRRAGPTGVSSITSSVAETWASS